MIKTILVVDDNKDILEATQLILELENYTVLLASSSQEAYQQIHMCKPDLILLDVLLSGEDGRELCKELKADPQYNNIIVIMLSAHPQIDKTIKESSADGFIEKPFDIDDLINKIKSYSV